MILDDDDFGQKTATIVSQSQLATKLGIKPADTTGSTQVAGQDVQPVFTKPEEQKVAQIAYEAIRKLENQPTTVPNAGALEKPGDSGGIVKAVQEQHRPAQMELEGVSRAAGFRRRRGEDGRTGDATDDRHSAHSGCAQGRGEGRLQAVHTEAGCAEVSGSIQTSYGFSTCAQASWKR